MRVPVELKRAYRLLNHGPTVLVSSAHGPRRNVMAAAWCMPLDYEPPKLAVVVAEGTFTRELVEASGELVVQVPTVKLARVTHAVGSESGRDVDKFHLHGLATAPASKVSAPLVEGCIAWLEGRVVREPHVQQAYDLFIVEVVAAWADDAVFDGRSWRFPEGPEGDALRSIHHVAGGAFFATGRPVP